MNNRQEKLNYLFGVGTIGRDMVFALQGMYLMYYLTDVLNKSKFVIAICTIIILVLRIFDAANDPFMGMLIDNTRTKYGKFKPWIFFGSIASAIATILLFMNYDVSDGWFVVIFALLYLLWGLAFTAHDISYWSMLPALSQDQRKREKIGSIAKICADIGLFTVVLGIVPVSKALSETYGSMQKAYSIIAICVSVLMLIFLFIMLSLVREDRTQLKHEHTDIKEILHVIVKNDQLMWIILSMALFTISYTTTTSFGIYYFKYVYGNEDFYSVFAGILGISQISALIIFPLLAKPLGRKKLYTIGTILVVIGYAMFFFANKALTISAAGILIFVGEGFIQILMLMFISDCVEYGQWKLGRRNDSITLSIQPFIAKLGSAISAGIVGATVILAGIKDATGPQDLSTANIVFIKTAMLILPLIGIVVGYFVYRNKFIIDEQKYSEILNDLKTRES
ncbi:MAG: glycoside-pentoside-hexuronide (GPH):cation symporter [Eubacteriales bacterium]|nr:glycoside-pentoside-hexuronide (GPH):cation symporter [Eubacteriales bacterium]